MNATTQQIITLTRRLVELGIDGGYGTDEQRDCAIELDSLLQKLPAAS